MKHSIELKNKITAIVKYTPPTHQLDRFPNLIKIRCLMSDAILDVLVTSKYDS